MSSNAADVGVLGLGGLGLPVAANLAKTLSVAGFDPQRPAGHLVHNVATLASVEAVAAATPVTILCLPSPKVSIEVVATLARLPDPQSRLIIELSTIGIETAQTCAAIAEEAGVGYLDAPVSGLAAKAWAAALTVMAAGRAGHIARARPFFELISAHVFELGDRPGLGQAMKLANNVINATSFAITSEAIAFGIHAGLDLAQMLDILNVSTGRTSASLEKFPQGVLQKIVGARCAGRDHRQGRRPVPGRGIPRGNVGRGGERRRLGMGRLCHRAPEYRLDRTVQLPQR